MAAVSDQTGNKYADVLRVLGKFLDAQEAKAAEIAERGTAMAVSWESHRGSEQRLYNELDISDLRMAAQLLRGNELGSAQRERAELLRTLGQELDTQEVQLDRIIEDEAGYAVTATVNGEAVTHHYPRTDLRNLSDMRRTMRSAPDVEGQDSAAVDEVKEATEERAPEQTPPVAEAEATTQAPEPDQAAAASPAKDSRGPWWRFW